MTGTVTKLAGRHSWNIEPRADDPTRHIRTCKRDGCGLRKRSELVDGVWLELWLWPDGERGDTSGGGKVPSCRAGQAAVSRETVADPAPVPSLPAATPGGAPGKSSATPTCCRCVPPLPPCGQPTRRYLAGDLCDWQAGRSSGGAA
jgi:hypothetical protein